MISIPRRLNSTPTGIALTCVLVCGLCGPCFAQDSTEPNETQQFRLFVEGLRQRQWSDSALDYLELVEAQSNIDPATKAVLSFERARTLLNIADRTRLTTDREQYISQAEAALKQFTTQNPNHPETATADTMLGELLIARARTLLYELDLPANQSRRAEIQNESRGYINQAQEIYSRAREKFEQVVATFPVGFIDETREPEMAANRLQAENRALRAWFSQARCIYERGKTFDDGTDERLATLKEAAAAFEEIYKKERKTFVGQQSLLMQGKCFEEQGGEDGINTALGLYNTVLGDRNPDVALNPIPTAALNYRLICLNTDIKKDYQLVVNEATIWLRLVGTKTLSEDGLGILWQRATAYNNLSKASELSDPDRQKLLQLALADAKRVSQYGGGLKLASAAFSRSLQAELGSQDEEPADFDTAYERGRTRIEEIPRKQESLAAAENDQDRLKAEQEIELLRNEARRLLTTALTLADESTDPKILLQTQYMLSYLSISEQRYHDALILATHVMDRGRAIAPDTADEAASFVMVAADGLFREAPEDDRDFESRTLREVCLKIVNDTPNSLRASEARMALGRVASELKAPLQSWKWYLAIANGDANYPLAQINAGQAMSAAALMALAKTVPSSSEDADELNAADEATITQWQDEAAALLQNGIQLAEQNSGDDGRLTVPVVSARASLSGIRNMRGQFAESIELLTGGSNPVTTAIAVPQGEERPSKGIQSRGFAGQVLRQLLRAYVGVEDIDNALRTMNELENLGGQNTTAIYTQLGEELRTELTQLQDSGQTERLQEVRTSFERFLQQVFAKRDANDYQSLVWIGETYFNLAKSATDGTNIAQDYYDKAASAFHEILSGQLTSDKAIATTIKMRLVQCRRNQGNFEEADRLIREILTEQPLALDAQIEAATILQEWGKAGSPERLLDSIRGVKAANGSDLIWGWAVTAGKLKQLAADGNSSDEMREKYYQSAYNISAARRAYAGTGASDAQAQLREGVGEIGVFAMLTPNISDEWFSRFEELHADLQRDLKLTPQPLKRPEPFEPVAVAIAPASTTVGGKSDQPEEPEIVVDKSGANPLAVGAAVLIALLAAGGLFFAMNKPKKRVSMRTSDKLPPINRAAEAPVTRTATAQAATRPAGGTATANAATGQRQRRPAAGPSTQAPAGEAPPQQQRRRQVPPEGTGAQQRPPQPGSQPAPPQRRKRRPPDEGGPPKK